MAEQDGHAAGRVVRVIGPVVDVEFPPAELPEINTALRLDVEIGGERSTITCEVAQHIGDSMVRAIALKPTDGVVRGTPVENTGGPAGFIASFSTSPCFASACWAWSWPATS